MLRIATAKSRARESWSTVNVPHKDVQYDIESCLQIDAADKFFIHLSPTEEKPNLNFNLGYNLIPKEVIEKNL